LRRTTRCQNVKGGRKGVRNRLQMTKGCQNLFTASARREQRFLTPFPPRVEIDPRCRIDGIAAQPHVLGVLPRGIGQTNDVADFLYRVRSFQHPPRLRQVGNWRAVAYGNQSAFHGTPFQETKRSAKRDRPNSPTTGAQNSRLAPRAGRTSQAAYVRQGPCGPGGRLLRADSPRRVVSIAYDQLVYQLTRLSFLF
jgi:hypothetical protein